MNHDESNAALDAQMTDTDRAYWARVEADELEKAKTYRETHYGE